MVFCNIRDAILNGSLKPGERLLETQLADKIGVSRTPVREALRKLELEGFVKMIPRKGAMVTVISEKDIIDVLEIRSALEGLAVKYACDKMSNSDILNLKKLAFEFENATTKNDIDLMIKKDIELHELILSSTKNQKLIQLTNNLREQIYRIRIVYLKDVNYIKQIVDEHKKLVSAIEKHDKAEAVKISDLHIKNQEIAVINSL